MGYWAERRRQKEKGFGSTESSLCPAPLHEEEDFDAMSQQQLRAAAKSLGVKQQQSNDKLREACECAVRELQQQKEFEGLDVRA